MLCENSINKQNLNDMKTQEEIETMANDFVSLAFSRQDLYDGFINGYFQCQQDLADESIRFAEWLVGDINGNGATEQELQDNTTSELYTLFIKKQN